MDSEPCTREIRQVADTCDTHLASWAYWQFKTYHDITTTAGTGSEGFYDAKGIQVAKVRAAARTFVRHAQGTVRNMQFDSTHGHFRAEIEIDTAINASTEVHALENGK